MEQARRRERRERDVTDLISSSFLKESREMW